VFANIYIGKQFCFYFAILAF